MDSSIIETAAYARAGLLGNPTDGYHGKTISIIVRNFGTRISLYPSPELCIEPQEQDLNIYRNMYHLVDSVRLTGYYGGSRLVKAAIKKFSEYCDQQGIRISNKNFTIRYHSSIPRQVGLARSSAIVTATMRALMRYYGVNIPREILPSVILSAEKDELGINAGLQDRVAQVYEGCVYMDFNKSMVTSQGYGKYEPIDPKLLPNLYLAYKIDLGKVSGTVLNDIRSRYDKGDQAVIDTLGEMAQLAEEGKQAILDQDTERLNQLIDRNFDLRCQIMKLSNMIRKAVIPAAGLGTRFLPATKAQPKEMLPIIDTPTIQYVVQEAVDSGIEDILIISGKGKRTIEDHFDRNFELESRLAEKQDESFYNEVVRIADMANIHFIRQKETNGLGDAIYHARHHVGDEPFAVLLGDTIINSMIPVTQQLIDTYEQYRCTVIAVEEVPKDKVSRYGIAGGKAISDKLMEVNQLVEKPSIDEAPSNLAIAGRYILTTEIFRALEQTKPGKGGEVQLTDALHLLMRKETLVANTIEGKRYDIGNKLDFLKTTVEFALQRKEFAADFLAFLKETLKKQEQS